VHLYLLVALLTAFFSLAASADEVEMLRGGEPANYSIAIEPGKLFTVNFIVFGGGANVTAVFTTEGPPVVPSVFAHPRSDIVKKDGSMAWECPGLDAHPLEVSSASRPMTYSKIPLSPKEEGFFGYAFHNTGDETTNLQLSILSSENIAIAVTGVMDGDQIPLKPAKAPTPEAGAAETGNTEGDSE